MTGRAVLAWEKGSSGLSAIDAQRDYAKQKSRPFFWSRIGREIHAGRLGSKQKKKRGDSYRAAAEIGLRDPRREVRS